MTLLQLLVGLVGLVVGGELLVRGAVAIARRFDVSPLMIGLTLVGFGTSTPELVTSLQAALVGSPGIAVGNVVGSNICNILLILGVAALLCPVTAKAAAFGRDGTALVVATALCLLVVLSGQIGRITGIVFLALLAGYISLTWFAERKARSPSASPHAAEADETPAVQGGLGVAALMFVAGLILTVAGARFLVMAAIAMAERLGVSEAVIGLTVVAIGTSLPELVTSVVAAIRRHGDVAFGNIIGSNVFNILGILGLTAVVQPLAVPPEIARLDVWVMIAATALLLLVTITGWRISRREGLMMLGAYAGYIGWLVANV
ncbi:MAG TPA: calcium/sodium antiporter [Paracoccaceae bacterium]|nr:calcium/sodium antiporter [Paracoccaceae bacterium]